jgi:hypothetical protein
LERGGNVPKANPYAFFDCLAISTQLQDVFDAVAPAEVHLFAYLACLLSVYRGRPVATWGYSFAGTCSGSPFSPEVEESKELLIRAGHITVTESGYLQLTQSGCEEYAFLASLIANGKRIEYLVGACATVLTLPLGWIKAAITSDSQMRLAAELKMTRTLLTEAAIAEFHDDFELLAASLGTDVPDLMIPAVVWLRSMRETATRVSGSTS